MVIVRPGQDAFRYVYIRARSRDRVESMLEDAFANGEVSEAERPRVEKREGQWVVTLNDWMPAN